METIQEILNLQNQILNPDHLIIVDSNRDSKALM